VADDGGAAPGPGPDEVEGVVGAALEEGVAHELVGLGLVEDGAVLIGDGPVVTVGTDGVVDAFFAVAFEAGEEPVGAGGGGRWCRFLRRGRGGEGEQESESAELQHVGIMHEKCASRWPAHWFQS
jgi:hypothetical protein